MTASANDADIYERDVLVGHGVVDVAAAMTKTGSSAPQNVASVTGLGSLEQARGTDHVTIGGTQLVGEITVTGSVWHPAAWVHASENAIAWSGTDAWSGSSWSGSSWSGSSWSGSSWS